MLRDQTKHNYPKWTNGQIDRIKYYNGYIENIQAFMHYLATQQIFVKFNPDLLSLNEVILKSDPEEENSEKDLKLLFVRGKEGVGGLYDFLEDWKDGSIAADLEDMLSNAFVKYDPNMPVQDRTEEQVSYWNKYGDLMLLGEKGQKIYDIIEEIKAINKIIDSPTDKRRSITNDERRNLKQEAYSKFTKEDYNYLIEIIEELGTTFSPKSEVEADYIFSKHKDILGEKYSMDEIQECADYKSALFNLFDPNIDDKVMSKKIDSYKDKKIKAKQRYDTFRGHYDNRNLITIIEQLGSLSPNMQSMSKNVFTQLYEYPVDLMKYLANSLRLLSVDKKEIEDVQSSLSSAKYDPLSKKKQKIKFNYNSIAIGKYKDEIKTIVHNKDVIHPISFSEKEVTKPNVIKGIFDNYEGKLLYHL